MITRFYLPMLSTNVKHPKFGCHVTSLCQVLRRSAGSGGEDPENQVGALIGFSYSEIRFLNKNTVKCLKINAICRQSIYFFQFFFSFEALQITQNYNFLG